MQNCIIDIKKDNLNKNRNYNYLYANIALAIAGLGVIYLIVGLIHKAYSGHFLLFKKTQSSKLVNEVENSLLKCQTECRG